MERNLWVSILVILLFLSVYISGEMPENVTVHIWEGNVTITWGPPQENTGDYFYQVQLFNPHDSPGVWVNVSNCNLLKTTICNIGHISVHSDCKVRVGILTTQNNILWSSKHYINIRRSKLIAPTFTLSSTPFSVRVKIHRKQILDDIFASGVQYTTHLWPSGQKKQTLIKSDDDTDDNGEIVFTLLESHQEYCMFVKVDSRASDASNISSVQCIHTLHKLPLDIILTICFILLGLLGIMAFPAVFLCFMRRPQKMPSALKHFVNVWKPMTIASDQVETVTDKGWIFINNNNNVDTKRSMAFTEDDKERRESLDSGVSIEHLHLAVSNAKIQEEIKGVQVDSGCGSLNEPDVSGSVKRVTRQLFIHETHCSGKNEGTEDSGLGLINHEVSASLEGEDTGVFSNAVIGHGYRSQSPTSVNVQNDMDSHMAAPAAGYRSGQVTCMCSDHEYCIWCKLKNPFTADQQAVFDDDNSVTSSYLKKTSTQTMNLLNANIPMTESDFPDNICAESSQIPLSCPLLLRNENKEDSIMHARSFILDNMELTFS